MSAEQALKANKEALRNLSPEEMNRLESATIRECFHAERATIAVRAMNWKPKKYLILIPVLRQERN